MISIAPYTDALPFASDVAFVVGCGTSVAHIESKLLSVIHSHTVLTTNSGILLMPWENGDSKNRFWISNDSSVRNWSYWDKVLSSRCNKVIRSSWRKHHSTMTGSFYEFEPRSTSENIIDSSERRLAYCSSIPTCIDFAIQAQCKEIYLIGVDHYASNGNTHFWQLWPKHKRPHRGNRSAPNGVKGQQKAFRMNMGAFDALCSFAHEKGCLIYNCNEKSEVKSFPFVSFADVERRFGNKDEIKRPSR